MRRVRCGGKKKRQRKCNSGFGGWVELPETGFFVDLDIVCGGGQLVFPHGHTTELNRFMSGGEMRT